MSAKTKSYDDYSDYQKFEAVCEGLKDILSDKICDNFLLITNRYVAGAIQKERDKVISPELAELQKMLLHYQNLCQDAKKQQGPGGSMELDAIVKHIKQIYG